MLLEQIPILAERAVQSAEEREHARIDGRACMRAMRPLALDRAMTIAAIVGLLWISGRINPGVREIVFRWRRIDADLQRLTIRRRPADQVARLGRGDPGRTVMMAQFESAGDIASHAVCQALPAD